MRVKELIELLMKCDPEAMVSRGDSEFNEKWVDRIEETLGQIVIE